MATLDDIARHACLSRSSVAKILRDHPGFNAQTRERVQRIARQLNYEPNYLGRALAGGKTMAIGVLFSGLKVPTSSLQIYAIQELAHRHGYLPYIVDPRVWKGCASGHRAIRELAQRRVDGVIAHVTGVMPEAFYRELEAMDVPAVYMGAVPLGHRPSVRVLRDQAIEDAAEHLAALGHRHAVMFYSLTDEAFPELKIEPYRRAFQARGMSLDTDSRWRLDPELGHKKSAYQFTRRLLQQADRPTALLTNDDCAHAAIAAAIDAGFRVPEDLSVVGFDDLPHVQYLRPALTTIHQPREETGAAAFEMLLGMMQNPGAVPEPVGFACRLVIRDSTGPAPRPSNLTHS